MSTYEYLFYFQGNPLVVSGPSECNAWFYGIADFYYRDNIDNIEVTGEPELVIVFDVAVEIIRFAWTQLIRLYEWIFTSVSAVFPSE